ncbi:hypothetical protein [Spirosoma aerolatum]|uniref:hypothetical protein n=1 Tax=Spirosoma aerolatum TaxID=1211326 RepID=UPI0009AC92E0|nr:hypothetical protein [Spirosoma aerolatum]
MRTFILYLLLFATLLPTMSSWGIIAQYQLNKEYIARVLCENRNRPELHCDGKCYLAKRLKAQQEKQDKETTERVQKTPSIQLFFMDAIGFTCSPASLTQQTHTAFTYQLAAYSAPILPVFQPPCTGC